MVEFCVQINSLCGIFVNHVSITEFPDQRDGICIKFHLASLLTVIIHVLQLMGVVLFLMSSPNRFS